MIGELNTVAIDCPDPRALAAFYGEILGMRVVDEEDDWVTIAGDSPGTTLSFQLAPDLVPPAWPDPARPQQFHIDVAVEDIEAAEKAVLALGATRLGDGGEG